MDAAPLRFGQYPPPDRVLLHLSDTHLLAGGALHGPGIDTEEHLAVTLRLIERMRPRPDALVITGDLTDLGEPDAYRRLRQLVEPVAEALDAPVIWVAGNHDERPAMRHHLLGETPTDAPIDGVWDLRGLRVIGIDTTVPGWHHGDLDDAQLTWLSKVLAEPAPLGTILAMHHPPIPSPLPLFDILELRDQSRLARVLAGTDVRAILAGHLHYSTSATFAGIPVSVASSTCYGMNLGLPALEVNGFDAGQSFHVVRVYPTTITHDVVPVVDAPTGDYFSPEWAERMSRLSPEERLQVFSRKRR